VADVRRLIVPDGLAGMRLDAGLARLLGISRTTVATLIDSGDVLVDGVSVARSEPRTAGWRSPCPNPNGRRSWSPRTSTG